MAFPLFVLAMGIVAALGNTVANIVLATAIINLPFYIRVARAEVNVRRNAGYVEAARLAGNSDLRTLALHVFPNVLPPMMVQISLNMGWAILNAAGLSFIGLGVRPPRGRVGHHGRRRRDLHHLRRMVGGAVPRRGADARGVLLQPARRRAARHHGPEDARRELQTLRTSAGSAATRAAARVKDLSLEFRTRSGTVRALENVTLEVKKGETVGIVGESGSGKSVLSFAILRILDPAARVTRGAVSFGGLDVLAASEATLQEVRGREAAMIFQSARTALESDPPRRRADRGRAATRTRRRCRRT